MPIGAHHCKALSCTGFFRDGLLGQETLSGMPNFAVEHDGAHSGEALASVRVRTPNRTGRDSVLAACQMLSCRS